jgi:hypothetical protein
VNLFRENGFEAYAFSPAEEVYIPKWLSHPAPVISFERMVEMCAADDLIIGTWPSRRTSEIIKAAPVKIKAFYPLCNFFIKGRNFIGDDVFKKEWGYTHFWACGENNKEILDSKFKINSIVIPEWFDFELYNEAKKNGWKRENKVLVLGRKGRRFSVFARFFLKNKVDFKVIDGQFGEQDFIREAFKSKFFLHTAIGYQASIRKKTRSIIKYIFTLGRVNNITRTIYAGGRYSEGFPLPPVEATLAGCVVIGFAKNGDLEWMNSKNSFIAKDRSYLDLTRQIHRAINTPDEVLKDMVSKATERVKHFSKVNTWSEIIKFLENVS